MRYPEVKTKLYEKHLENPLCSLCNMEYNYGEDFGGEWCSDRCRYMSTAVRRTTRWGLVMKSQALWDAFIRGYYGLEGENFDCQFDRTRDLILRRKPPTGVKSGMLVYSMSMPQV